MNIISVVLLLIKRVSQGQGLVITIVSPTSHSKAGKSKAFEISHVPREKNICTDV